MTSNATASILLALYIVMARRIGCDVRKLSSTVQNAVLKKDGRTWTIGRRKRIFVLAARVLWRWRKKTENSHPTKEILTLAIVSGQ